MIQLRYHWLTTALMLLSTHAAAVTDDACHTEARLALDNNKVELAETVLLNHLAHEAGDTDARFMLARVYSWQKKWPQALALFNELLEASPDNTDYLLARANTFEWMGHTDEALLELEQAREFAPAYSALWRTEIALLVKTDKPHNRRQAAILADQARQKFPDENWDGLLTPIETQTPAVNQYAIEASLGHEALSNNRSAWESTTLAWRLQTPDKHYAQLQLDSFERFNLDDTQFGASYALPLADTWRLYAGMNLSPTHRVIASRILETRISKSTSAGINLHAGISHARYNDTSSEQIYLGAEYYWSDFRAAYTYRLVDVKNAGTGYNHSIQLNKYYASVNFIGVSTATGDDVEFDGTPNPPISNVLTLSLYGRHMFQPQWSLTYALTHHQQGDFYNRNGFVLGIKFDY